MITLFQRIFKPKQKPSNGPITTPTKAPSLRINVKGKWCTYNPKEDITAYEAARIHLLITVAAWSPMNAVDRDEYIDRYNLERHFDQYE